MVLYGFRFLEVLRRGMPYPWYSMILTLSFTYSWVQTQLTNHPDELWEDGVRDYLSHASGIMVSVPKVSFCFILLLISPVLWIYHALQMNLGTCNSFTQLKINSTCLRITLWLLSIHPFFDRAEFPSSICCKFIAYHECICLRCLKLNFSPIVLSYISKLFINSEFLL